MLCYKEIGGTKVGCVDKRINDKRICINGQIDGWIDNWMEGQINRQKITWIEEQIIAILRWIDGNTH